MRKRIFLFIIITIILSNVPVFAKNFTDVSDKHWARDDIRFFSDKGLVNGYSDGSFKPESPITRAEFMFILAKEANVDLETYTGEIAFNDVKQSHWARSAILWAAEQGIVMGYNDGGVHPEEYITRQELSAIFYRYLQKEKGVDPQIIHEQVPFSDDEKIASWAKDAIYYLKSINILSGYLDGGVHPGNAITRAEAIKILVRYLRGTKIYINDVLVQSGIITETTNQSDMIPLKPLMEAMGYQVSYYPITQLLTIDDDDEDIQCWIGKTLVYINGEENELTAPPYMANDQAMFPIESITLICKVAVEKKDWGDDGQSLWITCVLPEISRSANRFFGAAASLSDINGLLSLRFNQQKDSYYGAVNNGRFTYGSYMTAVGNHYIGQWADGAITGRGRFISSFGELYVGIFYEGHITEGICYFTDGSTFFGQWEYSPGSSASYPKRGQFTDAQGNIYGSESSLWENGNLVQTRWN